MSHGCQIIPAITPRPRPARNARTRKIRIAFSMETMIGLFFMLCVGPLLIGLPGGR